MSPDKERDVALACIDSLAKIMFGPTSFIEGRDELEERAVVLMAAEARVAELESVIRDVVHGLRHQPEVSREQIAQALDSYVAVSSDTGKKTTCDHRYCCQGCDEGRCCHNPANLDRIRKKKCDTTTVIEGIVHDPILDCGCMNIQTDDYTFVSLSHELPHEGTRVRVTIEELDESNSPS